MEGRNRRDFLKCGVMLGVAAVSTSLAPSNASASPKTAQTNRSGIKVRTLGSGKNTIKVSYGLGLGCMGMSFNRSFVPDRDKMITVIRKAYDMGVNLFDTAEAYGPFVNEELVGEAIAPFRNNITLCSKFGFDIQNGKMTGGFNSQPKHIKEVVNQSLGRLKTDHIDLLYQHRVDPKVPMEDVAGTVKDLIAEGKVRFSAQKPWVVPIPGTTKLAHLQENLWSSDFEFTPSELASFTAEITAIPITGDRYPTPQTR